MVSQYWVTHFKVFQFTSRKADFVCCSSTAAVPKKTKVAAPPPASSLVPQPNLDIEVYTTRLWTVSKDGELTMPVAEPPSGTDECFGPFWDVRPCGDRGGPPANKVRECDG